MGDTTGQSLSKPEPEDALRERPAAGAAVADPDAFAGAPSDPRDLSAVLPSLSEDGRADALLNLQRTMGNSYVQRALAADTADPPMAAAPADPAGSPSELATAIAEAPATSLPAPAAGPAPADASAGTSPSSSTAVPSSQPTPQAPPALSTGKAPTLPQAPTPVLPAPPEPPAISVAAPVPQPSMAIQPGAPPKSAVAPATPAAAEESNAALVIEQVTAAAAAGRQRVADRLAAAQAAILAQVQEQHAALEVAGTTQAAAIASAFGDARSQMSQAIGAAVIRLEGEATDQLGIVERWHADALTRAQGIVSQHAESARQLGATYADQAAAAPDTAAQTAGTELTALADQARALGETKAGAASGSADVAQAQARVARDLARDTADRITEGLPDLANSLRNTGADKANLFRQRGADAALQVETTLASAVTQLDQTAGGASEGIQQALDRARHQLANLETQIADTLAAQETAAQAQLQAQLARQHQDLDASGQQVPSALQQQGEAGLATADARVQELTAQLAATSTPLDATADLIAQAVPQVSAGYDGLAADIEAGSQRVCDSLAQASIDGDSSLGGISSGVTQQLASFCSSTQSDIDAQAAAVAQALGEAGATATDAGNALLVTFGDDHDRELGSVEHGFESELQDYQRGLTDTAQPKITEARSAVGTLDTRIDEAQQRAAAQVGKGWLARQWDQLKQMVSDPGFWVGLVVGLALTALVLFLLPEEAGILLILGAFAAVGAIAAFVGGVVSNWAHGRPLLENWWQNLLIGAVFGAALAGVTLVLGTGLVGILGVSLAAGVLTVITNVITRGWDHWDDNLLANMVFAGLFAWLARYLPRIPGRPPVDGEPPRPPADTGQPEPATQRPGRQPGEPEPGGEEPEPPRPQPTGMPEEFVAQRAALQDPRAIQQFDDKYQRIATDPNNPTPVEKIRFQGYLDAMKARGGEGGLERGLIDDWQKAHPAPEPDRPPFGDGANELPALRAEADGLRGRLETGKSEHPEIRGIDEAIGRLDAQREGPLKAMESGEIEATGGRTGRVEGVRRNVRAIDAEWDTAQREAAAHGDAELGKKLSMDGKEFEIDVTSDQGSRLVQVKNDAPYGVRSKNLGPLLEQAEQTLRLAAAHPVNGQPAEVVFRFPRGISLEVSVQLKLVRVNGRGVTIDGEIVPLPHPVPPIPGHTDDDSAGDGQ